jgi:hypothetical protein
MINNSHICTKDKHSIICRCSPYNILVKSSMHNYISECTDNRCVYTRNISRLRTIYESKIISFCKNKQKINILFYGSHKLLQEVVILEKIYNSIDEIHLVDSAYEKFSEFVHTFRYFTNRIYSLNPNIKIYIHYDLSLLLNDTNMSNKIDIIGGIDIDYVHNKFNHFEHRNCIVMTAKKILKATGLMILSQHFFDLVDISEYRFNYENKLVPCVISEYVKPLFYDILKKYSIQTKSCNLIRKVYHIDDILIH